MRLPFVFVFALLGCLVQSFGYAVEEPRVANERRHKLDAENDRYNTLINDPRLDAIRDKVVIGTNRTATLPMLALTTRATPTEQKAIELWQDIRRKTRVRFSEIHRQYSPYLLPFLDMEAAAEFSLVVDLYAGKLTYGEFNRQRLDVHNRTVEAIRQRQEEMRQQQEAAQQRRQDEWRLQQQLIAAQRQQEQIRYERDVRQQQILAQQRAQAEIYRKQQIAQQTQAQQNYERAMALGTLQTYLQHLQLINQQYQPARVAPFNCSRYGNTVTCY